MGCAHSFETRTASRVTGNCHYLVKFNGFGYDRETGLDRGARVIAYPATAQSDAARLGR